MSIRRALGKGDRELHVASVLLAVVVASSVVSPLSCYLEHADTHRVVDYVRYEATKPKPLVGLSLAAHNFEAYLHDTWNRYAKDRMSSRWVAEEYHFFIEENSYNERKLANEGGSDWTRPYAGILNRAIKPADDKLLTFSGAVAKIDLAADRVSASWRHTSFRHTHTVTYPCGSKPVRTCSRTVCDWTDHTFTLDRSGLRNGLTAAIDGWQAMPEVEKEPTGEFLRRLSDLKENQSDRWLWSPLVAGYQDFGRSADSWRAGSAESAMLSSLPTYPGVYTSRNPFCGPALSHPTGWDEHERVLGNLRHTVDVYTSMRSAVSSLSAASRAVKAAITEIENGNSEDALRSMADLAWDIHSVAGFDGHMHYGAVRLLLWLLRIVVAGLLVWLLAGLARTHRHRPLLAKIRTLLD